MEKLKPKFYRYKILAIIRRNKIKPNRVKLKRHWLNWPNGLVSKIENMSSIPSLSTLNRYAKGFGLIAKVSFKPKATV